jgi:dihydropteroate synthase
MGVLNVTPDSFSDGGRFTDAGRAVDRALVMIDEGADIIDVGGESTRPRGIEYGLGSVRITPEEEIRRVVPVIEELSSRTDIPISVDTYKAAVAAAALDAGAVIVNDISGFAFDPDMPAVINAKGGSAVVMHMKGTPDTMQQNPEYEDLFGEICGTLRESISKGEKAGISQMIVDPGIGFGKTLQHNLQLLKHLGKLQSLRRPILVGPSRKSFLGAILDLPVGERLEGTLAACAASILGGASLLRVHDVREVKRLSLVVDAIRKAGG